MMLIRRFHVWDDLGLLRSFYTRREAIHFIGNDNTLRLVVLKKQSIIDWSNFDEAPF